MKLVDTDVAINHTNEANNHLDRIKASLQLLAIRFEVQILGEELKVLVRGPHKGMVSKSSARSFQDFRKAHF